LRQPLDESRLADAEITVEREHRFMRQSFFASVRARAWVSSAEVVLQPRFKSAKMLITFECFEVSMPSGALPTRAILPMHCRRGAKFFPPTRARTSGRSRAPGHGENQFRNPRRPVSGMDQGGAPIRLASRSRQA